MSKKTRRFIFFSLIAIFLIASPLAVLYSQGYRFDFESFRVVQTGSFYFRVIPKGASIRLSNGTDKKTDLFFGSLYLENLLPGDYQVTISKENHHSWQKSLTIKEKLVTEAKNIHLFPSEPILSIVEKEISDIFPFHSKIIIKRDEDILLYDPAKETTTLLTSADNLIEVISSPNKDEVLLNLDSYYLLINLQDKEEQLFKDIEKPLLFNNKLFYLKDNSLFVFEKETESLVATDIISFAIKDDGEILSLSKDGYFLSNNKRLKLSPIEISSAYRLVPIRDEIAFFEDNDFYLYDKKIFTSSKNPILSPDQKKFAYSQDYEISIYYLEKTDTQPEKSYGDDSFLTRFSNKISSLEWLTDHYLIFNVGDEIKIIEIDDRDEVNVIDFISLPEAKILPINDKIYILSENNLFVTKF